MSNPYYPEGSMRGSGIYAEEVELSIDCPNCEEVIDDTYTTDDWGTVDDWIKCPKCGEQIHVYETGE